LSRPAGDPSRQTVHVAVGVVLRDDGAVLMADRPAGKAYAGYWEFPGGKVEPGETVEQALARELAEELRIDVSESMPWVVFEHDYPHAYVRLYFRRIYRWSGEPDALEGQRVRFVDPRREVPSPLLPAAVPVMKWLGLPQRLDRQLSARLAWPDPMHPAGPTPALRQVLIGSERFSGAGILARAQLLEAARRGADFVVAAPRTRDEAGLLCRDAPIPVFLRDAGGAEALAQLRRLGAHGLAD